MIFGPHDNFGPHDHMTTLSPHRQNLAFGHIYHILHAGYIDHILQVAHNDHINTFSFTPSLPSSLAPSIQNVVIPVNVAQNGHSGHVAQSVIVVM